MARKKHNFHCQVCHSSCATYKKGKKHRVIVCPKCGVIASNPLPLLALAPAAITAGASLYEGYKTRKAEREVSSTPTIPQKERLSSFEKALLIEMAERRR